MPRKRRLNETTPADESSVATMPPPPEGSVERVRQDSDYANVLPDNPNDAVEHVKRILGVMNAKDEQGERVEADDAGSTNVASDEVANLEPDTAGAAAEQTGPTPEHAYDVNPDGSVGNVRTLPLPLPSTNGKGKKIQISVIAGRIFNAQKCKFCGKKCPPHPARLKINRPLGVVEHDLCATCDEGFTGLLREIGEGEVTLVIVGPGGAVQTSMDDVLERDLDDVDDDEGEENEDHDAPPAEHVAERIRRIAADLPERPYDQGAAAFCEGIDIADNPYAVEPGPLNQDRRTRWDDGWIAAKVDALRAAGETEEADQLAAAAKEDLQKAVQSLANDFGAEVTVRGLELDGSEIASATATPDETEGEEPAETTVDA